MKIESLSVAGLRSIQSLSLDFKPQLNFLIGKNGSGKTTILEAISILTLGRSFRTRNFSNIIQEKQENLLLTMQLNNDQETHQIGYQRNLDGQKIQRWNRQDVRSAAELAKLLPFVLIDGDTCSEFQGAPKVRRQQVDWGLFHVEHFFINTWQQYREILAQRNAAIRQARLCDNGESVIQAWDKSLSAAGEILSELRAKYLSEIEPRFSKILRELLGDKFSIELKYEPGWKNSTSLQQELAQRLAYDRKIGYTTCGAHRFDILFEYNNLNAKDILSRGQYKIMVLSFILAQVEDLLSRGKPCLLMLDELSAELDLGHQRKVFNKFIELPCQIIMTALTSEVITEEVLKLIPKIIHME